MTSPRISYISLGKDCISKNSFNQVETVDNICLFIFKEGKPTKQGLCSSSNTQPVKQRVENTFDETTMNPEMVVGL
ncbi:hypothetical protein V2J09_020472 [Rumex salicifolius]